MDRRDFLQTTSQAALAVGILGTAATACRPAPGSGDPVLATFQRDYFLQTLRRYPVVCTYLGGDGFDPSLVEVGATLRDWAPAAIDAEVAELRKLVEALEGIDPAGLSPASAVDREVVLAQANYIIYQLADRRYHERAVDTYVAEPFRGVDWQIQGLSDAGEGMLGTEAEWDLIAKRVEAIPAYVVTARSNLEAGLRAGNRPDHRMVERDGVKGCGDNADYFATTLANVATPLLGRRPFAAAMRTRIAAAGAAAAKAWKEMGDWLVAAYGTTDTTDRFAAGEAEYAWRVAHCLRDPRTPEQLFAYGADQVALYEGKIVTVAQQVAEQARLTLPWASASDKAASLTKVIALLSRESPRNDDQLFEWYKEDGERAVDYGRQRGLFDIPADYKLDVEPTPPVLRSTIDAAYYPAPPFKKNGVGRFYLTPTGNDPGALQLNNKSSVADTAVHEGFPGHDWHYKYMTAHGAQISPIRWLTPGAVEDSFSMWEDSMAAEGWALYAEELMATPAEGRPFGFYEPGEYLYMLQGQLMRAVRVRVDVGIHTGRMTFDEAVDYFGAHVEFFPGARAKAASDPIAKAVLESATRAIYRYSKWPTQAITYNLGKVTIQKLRADTEAKLGSAFSAKGFHEKFMQMGTIPVGYFRESFLA
ncbi:MAG TPA: DUF885 domain-containing protein, partial [Gemmatimonadales bacterium]|nr:DUF885 domain-containing protein [Gemmatimonadales bacterium]